MVHTGLVELGLEPHLLSDTLIESLFEITKRYAHRVRPEAMLPDHRLAQAVQRHQQLDAGSMRRPAGIGPGPSAVVAPQATLLPTARGLGPAAPLERRGPELAVA